MLTVEPAPIEVTSRDLEVLYDGSPYVYEVNAPEDVTVVFEDTESHTSVGTYRTRFVASMPNGIPIEGEASLRIVDSTEPIVVKTIGGEFKYDGKVHGATVEVSTLPEGYELVEARSTASAKDVDDGPVTATCDILRIVNREGDDVTPQLNIVYDDAVLRITPRKLLVVTHDASREYNGKPLRADGIIWFLVKGETLSLTVTGSQTEIGESVNSYELAFDGSAKQSNYLIGESLGTLKVSAPAPAAVKPVKQPPVSVQASTPTASPETPPAMPAPRPVSLVKSAPAPVSDSAVPWLTPTIRSRAVAGGGARGTGHARKYGTRPVDQRPDLEGSGLGREFEPYPSIDMRPPADASLISKLHGYDSSACKAINDLLNRNPNGLLFECFSAFSTETDGLKESFSALFSSYSSPKYALAWIDRNCRDAFLIYVALLVHEQYDGETLWENLFKSIGLYEQDARSKFCKMFVSYLYQRCLRVSESNRERTYMLNSAVLHGGFSVAVWRDLWRNCFLPLARSSHAPKPEASGEQLLNRILAPSGDYRPRNGKVVDLLEQAPPESVAVLCGMAWKVAVQINERIKKNEETTLVSSCGLPDVAMSALRDVLAQTEGASGSQELFYLNDVSLVLDKAAGVIRFVWQDNPMPASLSNASMDYYVNGSFVRRQKFDRQVASCVLTGGSIGLTPCACYDLERRIVMIDQNGNEHERAVRPQSFQNSKPGCFEFVRDAHETYRFRSPDERLSKTYTRIAYLVEAGKRIEGVHGMRLVDNIAGCEDWSGMTIYEFDVEPGAAGLIRDVASGDVVSAWNEDYRVHIDKSRVIGTANGFDLYGHVIGTGETDVALPSISIDSLGVHAEDDVEVRFTRDGVQAKLDPSWDCSPADGSAELTLSFPSNDAARGIAECCVIEARQKSTGDTLLRYRFAIVPIQGFRLVDYKFLPDGGELMGIYQYEVTEPLTIKYIDDDGIEEHPAMGVQSNLQCPLRDDAVRVLMQDSHGRELRAELFLAGVEIAISQALLDASNQTAYVGLPTKCRLSYIDGDITISTTSQRRGRAAVVKLGPRQLISKKLDKAGKTKVNIFENEDAFKPLPRCACQKMLLVVSITYGFSFKDGVLKEATAPCKVLMCGRGFEFTDCTIRWAVRDGRQLFCMHFEGEEGRETPPCPLRVTFANPSDGSTAVVEVAKGQSSVDLPESMQDAYKNRKLIKVRIEMKTGMFGNRYDTQNPMTLSFQRGAKLGAIRRSNA